MSIAPPLTDRMYDDAVRAAIEAAAGRVRPGKIEFTPAMDQCLQDCRARGVPMAVILDIFAKHFRKVSENTMKRRIHELENSKE